MVGVVTTRHLLTHSAVIVHEFGALCLCRCLWRTLTADHAVTFLECANPTRRTVRRGSFVMAPFHGVLRSDSARPRVSGSDS